MIQDNEIPIIEPEEGGYWEIYPNRKIWHNDNGPNMKFKNHEKAGEKYDVGGGNWLRLKEGDNLVRIVSEFEDYGSHFVKQKRKSYICVGKEKNCWFCGKGLKPRVQYLGYAIDRIDGKVKLLQVGHQIFSQIGKYAQNPEYAFDDVPDYDITINKTGTGLETEYTVIPARKNTPLTEKEKEEMAKIMEKTPVQIIEERKAKLLATMNNGNSDLVEEEPSEEEINVEDIPF